MTRGLKVSVKSLLAELLQREPRGTLLYQAARMGQDYSESQGLREESELPALVTSRLWC